MRTRWLVLVGVLAGAPAVAQPFLFPLQQGSSGEKPPPASAPPVAPPQAGPSEPGPAYAGSTGDREEASQPEPRPEPAPQPEPQPEPPR